MAACGLRKVCGWAAWLLLVYGVVELAVSIGVQLQAPQHGVQGSCPADNEGQWSIGIFKGPSLSTLRPVEAWQPTANTPSAWPVANPVMTCAHVGDVPSSFVADPFLYRKDPHNWYMFYETKSIHNMQGDIGAAISHDGGLSWRHVGVVLDERWHLSYPFVFEHLGKMYMVPEGSTSGALRLYSTTPEAFPGGWKMDQVLINQPLIDASLVPPMEGVAGSDNRWYLFASNRHQPTSKNCRELEIWSSDSLFGPWRPHKLNPVRAGLQGSRMAGRPVVADGQLYRFAQDCHYTYGHRVRKFQVNTLNATHFQEREVPLEFDPTMGREPGTAWNSMRYHHIDAQRLPSGEWVALMDGDRYVSDYVTWGWVLRLRWVLPLALAVALLTGGAVSCGGLPGLMRRCTCGATGWRVAAPFHGRFLYDVLPAAVSTRLGLHAEGLPVGGAFDGESLKRSHPSKAVLNISKGRWARSPVVVMTHMDAALRNSMPLFGGLSGWQALALVLGALLVVWLTAAFMWHIGRFQVLSFILWYLRVAGGSPLPVPVDHQVSQFTMMVMSYDARLITLQAFVSHYSQCSSVAEIVVVWNKGSPPVPGLHLPGAVPVRVRVEPRNSMNNRFQPDPLIRTRGVLMLDDDILMPCADIERGFARWRLHPERVTGFYARLLEGTPPAYHCKRCESHTYASGLYNVILAGAAFMDHQLVFNAYSGHDNALGRAYVDRVFNCDDLLLNYLMAHLLKGSQYVEWVRPSKRFDVGRLTSKRLSSGNFGPVRHNCTRDFTAMFGNPLAGQAYPLNFEHMGKPLCPPGIGCMFV